MWQLTTDSKVYVETERAKNRPAAPLWKRRKVESLALLETKTFNEGTAARTARHGHEKGAADERDRTDPHTPPLTEVAP